MNRIAIMGRLTRDPEVRYTQNGKPVAQFTLAVPRTTKDKEGKYEADFIPVVLWGKPAELVGNNTHKGHRLIVEGRLQIRTFEDKSGQTRWVAEVIASSCDFIEKKENGNQAEPGAEEIPSGYEQFAENIPEIPF